MMMNNLKKLLIITALTQAANVLAYEEGFEGSNLPANWDTPVEWLSTVASKNGIASTKDGAFIITASPKQGLKAFSGKTALFSNIEKKWNKNATKTGIQSPSYYLTRESDLSFQIFVSYKGKKGSEKHLNAEYSVDGGQNWKAISALKTIALTETGSWKKVTLKKLAAGSKVAVRFAAYTVNSFANAENIKVGIDEFKITPTDGSLYKNLATNLAQAQIYKGTTNTSPTQAATRGGLPVSSAISHTFNQAASSSVHNKVSFVTEFNTGGDGDLSLKQCELKIKVASFDDSLIVKKENKIVFQFLQKHYEKNAKINALRGSQWQPWKTKEAGNPELVFNNEGTQLWVTNKSGSRVNILPLLDVNITDYVAKKGIFNCQSGSKTQWELEVANTEKGDTVKEKVDVQLAIYADRNNTSTGVTPTNGNQGAPSSASASASANNSPVKTGVNGVGSLNALHLLLMFAGLLGLRKRSK